MGSTNLDKRVQVSHSIIIRVTKVGLSPRANDGTRSSDFITDFLLDLRVLGEFEESEGQCVGGGFIYGNRLVSERNVGWACHRSRPARIRVL